MLSPSLPPMTYSEPLLMNDAACVRGSGRLPPLPATGIAHPDERLDDQSLAELNASGWPSRETLGSEYRRVDGHVHDGREVVAQVYIGHGQPVLLFEQVGTLDHEAVDAFEHRVVAGRPVQPIKLGTLWAIEESELVRDALAGGIAQADLALITATLLEPERILLSLLAGDLGDVRAAMLQTANLLTPAEARELDAWFASQMRQLNAITGDGGTMPGKSPAAPSP